MVGDHSREGASRAEAGKLPGAGVNAVCLERGGKGARRAADRGPRDLLGVRAGRHGGQTRFLSTPGPKEGPAGKGKGTTERSLWPETEVKGAETRISKRSKQRGGQGSEQADRQEAVDRGQNVSTSDAQGEQTRVDAERPRTRAGRGTETQSGFKMLPAVG